ncbi:MAG TPA: PQQ-binding-like beta-propeller repeat protein [Solirubrobacteraceae bacterium]|nr:PQQ-binding-like beta-propeller repeat protein [Solirubrobacteraceae bacterium]
MGLTPASPSPSPRRRLPATAALAVAVFAVIASPAHAAEWTTFGYDSARTGDNPQETALGVASAGSLREAWSAELDGVVTAQPLVVTGVRLRGGRRAELVIAATEHGSVSAHDAATGARVWRRALPRRKTRCGDMPGGVYGVSATPVVDRRAGRLLVVSADGRAHALSRATGAERPGWPVAVTDAPAREYVWGALALHGGRLYAATASHCSNAFFRGRIAAIDVGRHRVVRRWFSLPGRRRGGGMWGWGGIAVDRARGDLFAATADAIGSPAHWPRADSVVRLDRNLVPRAHNRPRAIADVQDSEFGGAPVLLDAPGCPPQLAVVHKSGALLLYDRDRIGAGPRQLLQAASPDHLGAYGTYAWSAAARTLFVANNSSGDLSHGLNALRLDETCTLVPLWSNPVGPNPAVLSPPVTANGVVYLATGFGREVWALEGATGRALWTSPRLPGAVYAGPTVANGRLFVAGWDERLRAYAPAS